MPLRRRRVLTEREERKRKRERDRLYRQRKKEIKDFVKDLVKKPLPTKPVGSEEPSTTKDKEPTPVEQAVIKGLAEFTPDDLDKLISAALEENGLGTQINSDDFDEIRSDLNETDNVNSLILETQPPINPSLYVDIDVDFDENFVRSLNLDPTNENLENISSPTTVAADQEVESIFYGKSIYAIL